MKPSRVTIATLVALALMPVACAGVRDRIAARPAPASTLFHPEELVDVLPPDRIEPIDRPTFESAAKAEDWLEPSEPVVAVSIGNDARAYPLAILLWHEIVNDSVGGRPVAITFAPLTNAAVVFDREAYHPGSSGRRRIETFGISGKLYRAGLVMFDRRTRSLWPQLSARAVAGTAKGEVLGLVPFQTASLGEFRAAYPAGAVMARPEGSARPYGFNPYAGYDSRPQPLSGFFVLRTDPRLRPMSRVVGVGGDRDGMAVPFSLLQEQKVVTLGRNVTVFWRSGARSTLDATRLRDGYDIGQTGVFLAADPNRLGGRVLHFASTPQGFVDRETGSTWNIFGAATAGRLKGARLDPVPHVDAFWFAWAAFSPSTAVAQG